MIVLQAMAGKMAALWVLRHVYQDEATHVDNVFSPDLVTRDSAKAHG